MNKPYSLEKNTQGRLSLKSFHLHDPGGDSFVIPNVLFACRFGSHLHGTTTPTSDLDLKVIFINDIDDVILGADQETYNISSGTKESRNDAEDFDVEFIEIRKFLDDAIKGQTYAVELLFCDEKNQLYSSYVWDDLVQNKEKLLTSNVKPFIGYCVAQAKKYGMKGARLKATENALDFLKGFHKKRRVEDILEEIPKNEFVFVVEKDLEGQDEPVKLLEVNGKQFDMRVKLQDVTPVLQNLVNKYGKRAHKAKDGVDWKAICHAYRCIFELEELLKTGQITFPLKDRAFLKDVKTGQIAYEQVQEDLPHLIEKVENIDTDLPDTPDKKFWRDWTLRLYHDMYGIDD